MHEDVELSFDEHDAREIGEGFVEQYETVDGDHGRIEERRYTICTHVDWLQERHDWPGLKAIVMVESSRQHRGKKSGEKVKTSRRFYIASLVKGPEHMAQHTRSHWQVENNLHWELDMTFRQDENRVRTGNAAANLATIQHAAINLLKKAPGKKSLPMKRHAAAWDDEYLIKIITQ